MKKVLIAVIVFAGFQLSSCAIAPAPGNRPNYGLPINFSNNGVDVVIVDFHEGPGLPAFYGEATNTTDQSFRSCFVTLDLVDSDGAKVGEAVATTTGLAPKQKWKFDADITIPAGSVTKVQPGRVQCF